METFLFQICKLGYKSVAHYLIQTNKQSETSEDDETDDAPSQASAKRSLSFKEAKASSEEDHLHLEITDGLQDNHIDDNLDGDDEDTNKNPDSARKSLSFLTSGENQTSVIDIHALGDLKPLDVNEMDPATPVIIDVDAQYKENRKTSSKRKMSVKPNPDSIGGRLRQRRKSRA